MKRILCLIAIFTLAAFGAAFAQLDPDSPWPMFHANTQHTGRSVYAGSQTGTIF